MKRFLATCISYGLYPFLLIAVLATGFFTIQVNADYKQVYGITTVILVVILVTTETLFPLNVAWKMTKKSFWRDLRYIFIDAPVIGLTKTAFGWVAIFYSEQHEGIFSKMPLITSTIGLLLVFEFIQYWYHRLSHTGQGKISHFLWKIHLAHHLPEKVYVVMHAVFNPINAFITASIIQIPLILLGISPEAALIATLLIDLQSLVSHFNVNIKAGWLNYIFIGTETHRFHHSANLKEAQNYGNTLAIWDIIFGTFYYAPNHIPTQLGVSDSDNYPKSEDILRVIALPFH